MTDLSLMHLRGIKMNLKEFLVSIGVPEQTGEEWACRCFNPDHEDHSPSASIYVGPPRARKGKPMRVPGAWVCYSCHAHGILTREGKALSVPIEEILDANVSDLLAPEPLRILPESWLDLFDYHSDIHPYWAMRFSREACWYWRLGWDIDYGRLTIPIRTPLGGILGVVRRALPGEDRYRKYLYPKGVAVSNLLFGYAEVANRANSVPYRGTIVLVEGPTDVIAAWESGLCAVGAYGSHLSAQQVRLLRQLAPLSVCVAADQDLAGAGLIDAAIHELTEHTVVEVAKWDRRRGKDLASLPVEARKEVVASAEIV